MDQQTNEVKRFEIEETTRKYPSAVLSKKGSEKNSGWGKKVAIGITALVLLAALVGTLVYYNIQPARKQLQWYHEAVVYQIYPRSFMDSNGDGVGDIKGIKDKLQHVADLGITAIWISPFFKSPMKDFGYDISDFKAIEPVFGTLEDFREMMKEAKRLNLRVILDFVPNHTSDESDWFKKSEDPNPQTAEDRYFRDFYVWHDGHPTRTINETNGVSKPAPPNNWKSVFGNSAWKWSDKRKQYFLHQFLPSMPDLNWYKREVSEEMDKSMIFWLDEGVDGFRIDSVPHMFEIPIDKMVDADDVLRNPWEKDSTLTEEDYEYWLHPHTKNLQATVNHTRHWVQLMSNYTKEKGGDPKFLIYEVVDKNVSQTLRYFPEDPFSTAAMPFYFGLVLNLNKNSTGYDIERNVLQLLDNLPKGAWPSWVIGNHDQRRVTFRLGNRALVDGFNMLNLLLPGIPTTYYGEEIGMLDTQLTSVSQVKDPYALNFPGTELQKTRDYSRSPMQWDNTKNAGFSSGDRDTWLPIAPEWDATINVKYQKEHAGNHTHYGVYRDLMRIRKTPAFATGQMRIALVNEDMFSFIRWSGDVQYLVAIDLRQENSNRTVSYDFTGYGLVGEARLSCGSVNIYKMSGSPTLAQHTYKDAVDLKNLYLEPSAAVVLRVSTTH